MEYIPSYIFETVKEDRKISGRELLILIFNPLAEKKSQTYWKYRNIVKNVDDQLVPAEYKMKIINGRVKMTK
jgi:hypothetical protein